MSIKFFSGLQDLLGLYDTSVATTSHTAHIPSSSGLFSSANVDPAAGTTRRKSSAGEAATLNVPDDGEQVRKCSHARKVRFDDSHLISGYCEASAPAFSASENSTGHGDNDAHGIDTILSNYRRACRNFGTPPIASVERQIERLPQSPCSRQEMFSVKGERVSSAQMEALEEVFRRVQFETLDFEYTFLDDDAAIALSEMVEFYESANKLNLSFNKQISVRGWNDIFKAVKNSNHLHMINLRYTSLSEKSLSALCRVLRGTPQPVLGCLHLENVNLYGKNLYSLVCALKFNTVLKELYLGENSLQSGDGAHLYQLLMNNSTIQMLDLRNNNLGDIGVAKICEALRNPEVVKKTSLTALVLWNNKITANGMDAVSGALCENSRLETLNIGNNPLGELGIQRLRPALGGNGSNLHRLGLQSTQMNCQSAIMLAECLADNSTLIRVDLRDNPGIGSAGLLALHSAMKINSSISLLNLDQSCVVASNMKVRPYQEEFRRYYEDIKRYCERNKVAVHPKPVAVDEVVDTPKTQGAEKCEVAEEKVSQAPIAVAEVDLSPSHCQPTSSSGTGAGTKGKFMRSSSLTCTETVADIHERIRVLGGSTHSLDETNTDATKTIKKSASSSHHSIGLAEWGSLPAIPQADSATKPVVRKLRRFSVSPSSSTFDVVSTSQSTTSTTPESLSRPKSLAISIPRTSEASTGPHSASVVSCSSLPDSLNTWPSALKKDDFSKCSSSESTSLEQHFINENVKTTQKATPQLGSDGSVPSTRGSVADSQADLVGTCEKQHRAEEEVMGDVRVVIGDLVNYVVYEETSRIERKRSLLLQNTSFPAGELSNMRESTPDDITPSRSSITPSRMVNIAEEFGEETVDMVVSSVVRSMIRDVLRREKEELRNTLDRRRKRKTRQQYPAVPEFLLESCHCALPLSYHRLPN
ncbi:hypothetical protein Q1695_002041 [Nippostrongylus brasiliensis]|nr:hypothetical protein Q1695_002041 [Nippostrongylus brasiliensis]